MGEIFTDISWFYANIDDIIDLSTEGMDTTNEGANTVSPCNDIAGPSTKYIE